MAAGNSIVMHAPTNRKTWGRKGSDGGWGVVSLSMCDV